VPYHLSKRLLFDLTKMMAVEFAPRIRVNGIAPGLILPPEGQDDDYLERLADTNPLHDHGSPKDITDALLYLVLAEFVTGQVLFVDGGRHLKGNLYV
jgi:NAD(P)-dependent dehydrogenase (short-subunit alcohol dehydrogenase family)